MPLPSNPAPHNLPLLTMPFVGREDELNTISELLADPSCRLLTLVGPGGIGKTYLAVESAHRQLLNFDDGLYFVSLTPLTSTDDIIPTVANALNFRFNQGESPKRQFLNHLRGKSVLLVMDNFDELVEGADFVAEMLQSSPGLKVLVTSRERLNLQEETVYRIEGMRLPEDAAQAALNNGAVRLFAQNAKRLRADFELDSEMLPPVVRICQLVDGMPLGIVLAASWIEMLTAEEIAQEIARSVDFLQTEMRNVPSRHRSIRAVFESAWKMLAETEQAVFAGLSVFRGGFTREAAEAMDADLRTLMALVNKSLLRRDMNGRYHLHELLRQYAAEQLEKSGQAKAHRDAHCRFYADFLNRCAEETERRLEVLEEIEADFENVRAAWMWAVESDNGEAIGRALEGICLFCTRRGRYQEGLRLFDRAIEMAEAHPQAVNRHIYLRLYEYRGEFQGTIGQFGAASKDLHKVLDAVREEGVPLWERNLLVRLGFVCRNADQIDRALSYLSEALNVSRSAGNPRMVAETLYHLGTAAWSKGDNRQARDYHQEAVDICESLGLSDRVAVQAIHGLGEAYWAAGRPQMGIEYTSRSLEMARAIGDKNYESENLQNIGWASMGNVGLGDYQQALTIFRASLAISEEAHLWHIGPTAFGLGYAKGCLGDYEEGFAYIRQGVEFTETLGQIRFFSAALDVLGQLFQDLNLLDKAKEAHRQGVDIAAKSNAGFWLPRVQANLAIDRLRQGDMSVEGSLQSALDTALVMGQGFHAVRCLEGLAELALAQNQPELALRYADQLRSIAEPGQMREMLAQSHRWRGEALLAMRQFEVAVDELNQAAELADAIGRVRLMWEVQKALARCLREMGQRETARQHEARVQEIVARIADNLQDADMRAAFLESVNL
jgi:predicted ATPase